MPPHVSVDRTWWHRICSSLLHLLLLSVHFLSRFAFSQKKYCRTFEPSFTGEWHSRRSATCHSLGCSGGEVMPVETTDSRRMLVIAANRPLQVLPVAGKPLQQADCWGRP